MPDSIPLAEPDLDWLTGGEAEELFRWLMDRQDELDELGLGTHGWWRSPIDVNGRLLFGNGDTTQLECDITFLGTQSNRNGSWMWAWHNSVLFPELARAQSKVVVAKAAAVYRTKMFELPGIALQEEQDAFVLAAACCKADDAIGVYRMDNGNAYLYAMIAAARRVEYPAPPAPAPDRTSP